MRFIYVVAAFSVFTLSIVASSAAAAEKRFSMGGGFYGSTLSATGYPDEDFFGFALTGTAALNNYFGGRLTLFFLEHDDDSRLKSKGSDLLALVGYNLAKEGFKFYGGLGVFSDTWSYSGGDFSKTFSDSQFSIGLGYNWSEVALDISLNIRNTDDYEKLSGVSVDAASSLVSLAYRF